MATKKSNRQLWIMLALIVAIVAVILLLPSCGGNSSKKAGDVESTTLVKAGDKAPDFTVEMFGGGKTDLAELKGKVVGLIKSGEHMICVRDESQLMPDFNSYGFAYISPAMYEKATGVAFYPQINALSDLDKKSFTDAVDDTLGTTRMILTKDENISYVETLGLAAYLDELEKENNAYISLTSQRTQNRAANKKESGAVLRERIDGYYEDLVMLAQSYSVAVPLEAATAFVNNLNQLITETTTANNQRKKRSGSNGNGADDSERPGELSV